MAFVVESFHPFLNPSFQDRVNGLPTCFKILSNAVATKSFCVQPYHCKAAFGWISNLRVGWVASSLTGSLRSGGGYERKDGLNGMMGWPATISHKTHVRYFTKMEEGEFSPEFNYCEPYGGRNATMEVFSLLHSGREQTAHALFLKPIYLTVERALNFVRLFGTLSWRFSKKHDGSHSFIGALLRPQ